MPLSTVIKLSKSTSPRPLFLFQTTASKLKLRTSKKSSVVSIKPINLRKAPASVSPSPKLSAIRTAGPLNAVIKTTALLSQFILIRKTAPNSGTIFFTSVGLKYHTPYSLIPQVQHFEILTQVQVCIFR